MPLVLAGASAETRARAGALGRVRQAARAHRRDSFADAPPQGSVQLVVRGEVAALPLKGVIDLDAERARLQKEMAKVEADIKRVDAKLGNPQIPRSARPRRWSRRSARSARRPKAAASKIVEALERLKGAA